MNETQAAAPPRMTVDEFLAWDGGGHQGKLELVDGAVRAVPPPSATHAVILGNLLGLVDAHIRAHELLYRVETSALIAPHLSGRPNLRTPDLAVIDATVSTAKLASKTVIVAEALSRENESAVQESFWAYTTVPSVREILIVDTERVCIEICRKGAGGNWEAGPEVVEAGGTVHLHSIEAPLSIAEIYAGTFLA
jgi:Uma2 family endonuclease